MTATPEPAATNFIEEIVEADRAAGKHGGRVQTRFPPEPNGYLHIGHAKSICLNFGLARKFGGKCNLRFDDTNPTKEEQEYVDSIMADVRWLGFEWDGLFYASDYFGQLYDWAVQLVQDGKAYVCDLTGDEVAKYRGGLEGGKESPYRNRSVEENLDLLARMKAGEFPDGSRTLRARIDMKSPNFNMRDPVLYRILHAEHHRTGNDWCIYPMYDWAHGQSDSLEQVTHSICTLEFENHRPLYDWFIQNLGIFAAAADRVLPAQPDVHPDEQAQAAHARAGEGRRRLGRPAHADARRGPAARLPAGGDARRSARASACRSSRAPSTWPGSRTPSARNSTAPRTARPRGPAPGQARHRQLPRGPGRGDGGGEHPQRQGGRQPQGAVLEDALRRARGLHGEPAEGLLPPRAGQGGPPALRLPRDLHGRRQRPRDGRGDRDPLHLRPGHEGRQHARRPQGQGDDPLGAAPTAPSTRRCASTTTCSGCPTPTPCRRAAPGRTTSTPRRSSC